MNQQIQNASWLNCVLDSLSEARPNQDHVPGKRHTEPQHISRVQPRNLQALNRSLRVRDECLVGSYHNNWQLGH